MIAITDFFKDVIQITILWMQNHPHAALLLTLVVACIEAVAVLGILIPGSVTMTFLGLLVGAGIMRLDLTLLATIIGTVIGNGISYTVGAKFSDTIITVWPFNKYPHWFEYAKTHFIKHGGKSILIGQFLGPVRSMIPLIAGIMHMQPWRFYCMTSISALLWAIIYISPGTLIGTASRKFTTTVTMQIFIILLLLLALVWLASIALKWLCIKYKHYTAYYSIIAVMILLCIITLLSIRIFY